VDLAGPENALVHHGFPWSGLIIASAKDVCLTVCLSNRSHKIPLVLFFKAWSRDHGGPLGHLFLYTDQNGLLKSHLFQCCDTPLMDAVHIEFVVGGAWTELIFLEALLFLEGNSGGVFCHRQDRRPYEVVALI